MGIVDNALIGASGNQGYNLQRSLRFRASASAYLNRTPASASNQKTWTWSGWVKRGKLSSQQMILTVNYAGTTDSTRFLFYFDSTDILRVDTYTASLRQTNAVYRDPSAWYHVVLSVDTTQATAANRMLMYVNGVSQSFSSSSTITQNSDLAVNSTLAHYLGYYNGSTLFYDGYLAEVNFIDGQALTPSSFGSTNSATGVWQPAPYTGTYGTNGFYLKFTDNSGATATTIGKDFSGNGNNWTPNNISVTAGVTYDSMTDVPTLTSATASNFCVGNPLSLGSNASLSNANLSGTLTGSGGWSATICGLTSGKWYYEATVTANSGNSMWVGFLSDVYTKNDNAWSYSTQTALYANDGRNGNNASYGATWTTNDVIGIAIDLSTSSGSITFYKNGVSQGVMFSSLTTSAVWRPLISGGGTGTTIAMNFGQRPFSYTPPTGYVALNTYNLPTATIVKGNTVMDATIWTGDGTSPRTITNAAPFQPDLVWFKSRSATYYNQLADSVRGATRSIYSNVTNAEENNAINGYLSSINSNGFSVINGSSSGGSVNANGTTYVAWQWQAGRGTTATNTSGSITSTVSVNTTAGFSIVSYTGTGANATVGHGLGVAPQLIITKNRSVTSAWHTYVAAIPNMQNGYIVLNASDAFSTSTNTVWNGTQPTSSVFSIGTDAGPNGSGNSIIAYCFTPIAGFSAMGSYAGNGSTDGPFIYTGFRPKFVMAKVIYSSNWWIMFDSTRNPYNAANFELVANLSDAEYTANTSQYTLFDFLSNGFKLRTGSLEGNSNGQTYLYIAFAENPFKNALAR